MVWKPFDTHFAEIIEKFETHSTFFRDLMHTTSTVTAIAYYDELKEYLEVKSEETKEQQKSNEQSHT